jgi:hypothetical protein
VIDHNTEGRQRPAEVKASRQMCRTNQEIGGEIQSRKRGKASTDSRSHQPIRLGHPIDHRPNADECCLSLVGPQDIQDIRRLQIHPANHSGDPLFSLRKVEAPPGVLWMGSGLDEDDFLHPVSGGQ